MRPFFSKGCIVLLLVLGICTWTAWSTVPNGYIIKVSDDCGPDAMEDASIVVTSDLDAKATARCADGDVDFIDTDTVHLRLSVSYPGQGSSPCVFEQRGHIRVFVMTVIVLFGEIGRPLHEGEQEFTITCTFDAKGKNSSSSQGTSDTLIAPTEIQGHEGTSETGTKFVLTLTDILDQPLHDNIAIGRVVKLRASTTGDLSEKGVSPESCDAVSDGGAMRYAIIRAGCGDGIVFKKDQGFWTNGTTSVSPLFEVFSLAGDDAVTFECNFTLCMEECNGSTCTLMPDRRRRSSHVGSGIMKTETLHLDNDSHRNHIGPPEDLNIKRKRKRSSRRNASALRQKA